mmetsp:Transcript_22265/g.64727  ORF Transcript_22265/g.64727 Transcript_22265/m.64727 type:complete len:217 (-) Transcript_22265:846-1496(-)
MERVAGVIDGWSSLGQTPDPPRPLVLRRIGYTAGKSNFLSCHLFFNEHWSWYVSPRQIPSRERRAVHRAPLRPAGSFRWGERPQGCGCPQGATSRSYRGRLLHGGPYLHGPEDRRGPKQGTRGDGGTIRGFYRRPHPTKSRGISSLRRRPRPHSTCRSRGGLSVPKETPHGERHAHYLGIFDPGRECFAWSGCASEAGQACPTLQRPSPHHSRQRK